jgi:hypothetical protein
MVSTSFKKRLYIRQIIINKKTEEANSGKNLKNIATAGKLKQWLLSLPRPISQTAAESLGILPWSLVFCLRHHSHNSQRFRAWQKVSKNGHLIFIEENNYFAAATNRRLGHAPIRHAGRWRTFSWAGA